MTIRTADTLLFMGGGNLYDPGRRHDIERAYGEYADMMYRLALTYLHNKKDAEDAVHDAFIAFIERMPSFADAGHERAWLCLVTINKCRDALRRRARRNHVPLEDADTLGAVDEIPAEVRALLDPLPEKLRLAAVLHYLEGFSIAETAKITGSTQSAVKMRLMRAREKLRETLGKEEK